MDGSGDAIAKGPAGRRAPATPEQMAARRRDEEARVRVRERKVRTRRLIRVGGVMAAWGITEPEQAEELMGLLTSPEREAWRRYLAEHIGARRTERWP